MDLTSSPLFTLAQNRLAWIDRAEEVRAENIANADTPGYETVEMPPFSASLDQAAGLTPTAISPGDIPLPPLPDQLPSGPSAPAVAGADGGTLDNQLGKLADSETMQNFVVNLYGAYLGMFRTALDISNGTG
jgi:flagellar basal-body rod protein FlgB